MKTFKTLAVIAAACLGSAAAWGSSLPVGTLITGQVNGASTTLLGLDHLFADESGSNTTALAAADLEFLTGDGNVAIDFFADGHVQVWNNSGALGLGGNYTFTFSFAGLGQSFASFAPLDVTELTGGSVGLQLVDPHTVSLTLTNLSFTGEFGSFTTQLNVATVPEPGSLALMGAGLGLLALRRTKRAAV
jgi:hypothetical protein